MHPWCGHTASKATKVPAWAARRWKGHPSADPGTSPHRPRARALAGPIRVPAGAVLGAPVAADVVGPAPAVPVVVVVMRPTGAPRRRPARAVLPASRPNAAAAPHRPAPRRPERLLPLPCSAKVRRSMSPCTDAGVSPGPAGDPAGEDPAGDTDTDGQDTVRPPWPGTRRRRRSRTLAAPRRRGREPPWPAASPRTPGPCRRERRRPTAPHRPPPPTAVSTRRERRCRIPCSRGSSGS